MNTKEVRFQSTYRRSIFFLILILLLSSGACTQTPTPAPSDASSPSPISSKAPTFTVASTVAQPPIATFTVLPLVASLPTPTITSIPLFASDPKPTPLTPTGIQYFIDLRCPAVQQVLPLVKQQESWRYSLSGVVYPTQNLDSLSLDVVYKRLGKENTDWTFVYGKGAKPMDDGRFQVDGYVGNVQYPPKEGEQVYIAVVLVDKNLAPGLDGSIYKDLDDLAPAAKSLELVYNLTLDPSVSSCQAGAFADFTPEKDYQLAPLCPTGRARIRVDKLADTWRYFLNGKVSSIQGIDNLTINIIYKRGGKEPTEWIFTDSGGVRPHPNGDFWLAGYIGEPDHPPEPGETFAVALALTDPITAEKLNNANKVDLNLFDGILGFSKPFYVTLGAQGEKGYYCQDIPVDATTPAAGVYNIRINCPTNDSPLTVYPVGSSWTYSLISQVEPASNIQKGDALFLAYKRLGDPNYWAYNSRNDKQHRGTDWILIGKPGSLITTTQTDTAQYQLEGWIGDQQFPPLPGEQLVIAVVLMDETEGRNLDTLSFPSLESIPTLLSYSYPVYVHIRKDGESEIQCLIDNHTATALQNPEPNPAAPALEEPMNSFDPFKWEKADGWSNDPPFWVGWLADHIEFGNGVLRLRLDDLPCKKNPSKCSDQPYASGEYRSTAFYSFGCYQARFKAADGSGLVSSFFTFFATPEGKYKDQDEIDIEILGKKPNQMQVNYFKDGKGEHEKLINLGFDASQDFHEYAFEWSQNTIKWFVDGKLLHTEDGTKGPLPNKPGQIMMNLWAGKGVDNWLGPFKYPDKPIIAEYDWVRYTPGECIYPGSNP